MMVDHQDEITYKKQISPGNAYEIDWEESRVLRSNILKNKDYTSVDLRRIKPILPQLGFKELNVILKVGITSKKILLFQHQF